MNTSKTHPLGLDVYNFKTKLPYKYKCHIVLSYSIFRPEKVNSYSLYVIITYPLEQALFEAPAQDYLSQEVLSKAKQHIHCK